MNVFEIILISISVLIAAIGICSAIAVLINKTKNN